METPNVMKPNEHYNLNSTPQLTAIQKSFAYIERAVQEHTADFSSSSQPFFIADYGCSHGANSLVAINAIIEAFQQKYALTDEICVVFNDLYTNDWTTVFQTVIANASARKFFSLAVGTSFYEQILPTDSVQFGYTSTALHWLSKKPCNLSRHCYSLAGQSTDEEMKLWREQAANDYRLFLEQRSKELKKGGIFLSVTLSRNHLNDTGNLPIYHNLYQSAKATLSDEDELLNFNVQGYYRSIEEQTDPDLLKELKLELISADIHSLQHPIYEEYRSKQITLEEAIDKYTEFVRSWSESSFISCLRKDRTEEERMDMVNKFWNAFKDGMREKGMENFQRNPFRSYIILRKL